MEEVQVEDSIINDCLGNKLILNKLELAHKEDNNYTSNLLGWQRMDGTWSRQLLVSSRILY